MPYLYYNVCRKTHFPPHTFTRGLRSITHSLNHSPVGRPWRRSWKLRMALFQDVLTAAGWDPAITPAQQGNCGNAGCVVSRGSGTKSVTSVMLIANGLCFAVMTIMFVGLGSAAEYGSFGRWLLLVLTVVCWVFQYGMMAIRHPSQWPAAMVLFCVSYIAYVNRVH
jgi:hypothetical protein